MPRGILVKILVLVPGLAFAAVVKPLPTTTHWVANTSGIPATHIQNYIQNMRVDRDGTVWTNSDYDEGGAQNAGYKDGKNISRWHSIVAHSDSVRTSAGVSWVIRNFYGRAFKANYLQGLYAPPTGDKAPMIVSSRGDTIFNDSARAAKKYGSVITNPKELPWIADPTALGVTNGGRLMVGDNGPNQNVRLIHFLGAGGVPRMDTVYSLGIPGGVYSTANGVASGTAGDQRFWGIRGLGTDSLGRMYVGMSGMPMQVGGGTDIRCFSSLNNTSATGTYLAGLIWKVQGLSFVNTGDFDPDSNGTSVYLNAERYHLDVTKAPGKSWNLAAITIDPFRYPRDPRLNHSIEQVWVRVIGGVKYMFLSDMVISHLVVVRFEPGSEIGIPAAWIKLRDNGLGEWSTRELADTSKSISPTWNPAGANYTKRWMWVDKSKDGNFQKNEFQTFNLPAECYVPTAFDISKNGDVTIGCGDIITIPSNGSTNGVLGYDSAKITTIKATSMFFRDSAMPADVRLNTGWLFNGGQYRMQNVPGADAMLIAGGNIENNIYHLVGRWDNWSIPTKRKLTWVMPVDHKWPTDNKRTELDINSMTAVSPVGLTADARYFYVTYMDNGPDTVELNALIDPTQLFWGVTKAPRRGQITVWDMKKLNSQGRPTRVGTMTPDENVGGRAGAIDLMYPINVTVKSNGERLVSAEEDGWGKVLIHRWCPDSEICNPKYVPQAVTGIKSVLGQAKVVVSAGQIRIHRDEIEAGTTISLLDPLGRVQALWLPGAANQSESWITLPVKAKGGLYVLKQERGGVVVGVDKVLLP